jgi:TolB-like protein/Flp pilus assembly protein TadD
MSDLPVIAFDRFEIDLARGELRRSGAAVPVEPQVLDLIAYLARNPGKVLSRDDLIAAVWRGRIVSDSTISSRINAARAALGDDGTAQRYIRTVPRRGFLFEAETRGTVAPPRDAGANLPSVAVLPFANMSGDPDQAYLSDGITDDIITELSRFGELRIIARHSAFAYRDAALPPSAVADALGVQYLVEGSVRRMGNRIRITAQLVDPAAGAQLWAEKYDRQMAMIFDVQDEITAMIVNTLAGQIVRHRHRRALSNGPETADAYDSFLKAAAYNLQMGPKDVRAAHAEAKSALTIDPGFARAHALMAWTHISEASNAWSDDPQTSLDKAQDCAVAAITADAGEPFGYAVLGWVHIWRDRNFERGLGEQLRAISLNPGSAQFRSLHAYSLAYAGRSEQSISDLDETMRLDPHHPELHHVFYGRALFNLKRYADAIGHLERIRTSMPGNSNAIAHAAACYAALDRPDDARAAVDEVQRASPRFTLAHAQRFVPYALKSELEHFLELAARAGLPKD